MGRPGPAGLAAGAGGALFLAFLPGGGWPLVFVALVPWILTQDELRRRGGSLRDAARLGALFGATFWGLNLAWVPLLVVRIGALWPLAGWLGQVLLLALLWAGAGVLFHRLRGGGRSLPVAALLAFMAVEWTRGHLLGPLRFPWSPLALPLTGAPAFLQPGAWVGAWGLGAGVVLVNGLLAVALVRRRSWPVLGAAVFAGSWFLAGTLRMDAVRMAPVVQAGVVQPAIPLADRRTPGVGNGSGFDPALEAAVRGFRELLDDHGRGVAGTELQAGRGGVPAGGPPSRVLPRVVVLPETHLPRAATTDGGLHPDVREALGEWAERLDAELLVGGYGAVPGGRTNAVYRIAERGRGAGTAGTEDPARYDKTALVPGVEWAGRDGLVRGAPPTPLDGAGRPGPLICIESAWTAHGVAHARGGARWLVNVTNDAWLAEAPLWTRTHAFAQHPAHLQLRAVETGLGALRVGNNGLTGVVDPVGRWRTVLPPHRPGAGWVAVEGRVPPGHGTAPPGGGASFSPAPTDYVKWGHPIPAAVSLVTLLLAGVGVARPRGRGTGAGGR